MPPSDNNHINGKPSYQYLCSNTSTGTQTAGCTLDETHQHLSSFHFEAGKAHRLRLINAGAAAFQYFSIDGHNLEVIANDFVPLLPYNTSVASLGIGQRTDVIVHATGDPSSAYWMRASVGTNCSRGAVNETKAIVYYDEADASTEPLSLPHFVPDQTAMCRNVSLL